MELKHLQHLYNRIGFGTYPKELATLLNKSKNEVVSELFNNANKFTDLNVNTSFFENLTKEDFKNKKNRQELVKKSRKKIIDYNIAWLERLKNPNALLREKMTLFWANHFVCENKNILFVQQYNNTLRNNALGNFGDFIKAIAKAPAMLNYLNNKQNRKRSPNENFARELMELFTLGQGNYTEKDIKESARAFTGFSHNFKGAFKFRKKQHDFDKKLFLGKTGNFNGDDIIDIILEEKQCAKFISEKIYRYFVNEKLNETHIKEMVSVFYPSYNIEKLMQHVFLSDWFYSEENIGTKIKSPIELLVGINKIVPYSFLKKKQAILLQKILGQILLRPPNVAGWKGGRNWIDSNTIVTRLRLASVLLNNAEITYSDKGDLEDNITDFNPNKLRKKAFIKTTTDWNVFLDNFKNSSNNDMMYQIITSPIHKGTQKMLSESKTVSKEDFCVQLMSLPEYQLC